MKAIALVMVCLFVLAESAKITSLRDHRDLLGTDLLSVDVPTGKNVTLSEALLFILRQSLGALDTKNNIFYTVLYDFRKSSENYLLVGYDLKGNNVTIPLPFIPATFIIGLGITLNYDPNTGNLWLAHFEESGFQVIGSFNVTSRTFTKLVEVESNIGLIWPATAFDPIRKVLVTQYAFDNDVCILGYNTTNGKLLYNVSLESFPLSYFDYDIKTSLLYGISYSQTKSFLVVDPENLVLVSSKPIDFHSSLSNVVVDSVNRNLIAIIQFTPDTQKFTRSMKAKAVTYTSKLTGKKLKVFLNPGSASRVVICDGYCTHENVLPNTDDRDFSLVAYDLATAKIVTSPKFCAFAPPLNYTYDLCPIVLFPPQ